MVVNKSQAGTCAAKVVVSFFLLLLQNHRATTIPRHGKNDTAEKEQNKDEKEEEGVEKTVCVCVYIC